MAVGEAALLRWGMGSPANMHNKDEAISGDMSSPAFTKWGQKCGLVASGKRELTTLLSIYKYFIRQIKSKARNRRYSARERTLAHERLHTHPQASRGHSVEVRRDSVQVR